MASEQSPCLAVTPIKRPRGRPRKSRPSHEHTPYPPINSHPQQHLKHPMGRPPKPRLPLESPISSRLRRRTQSTAKANPDPGQNRNILKPKVSPTAKSQSKMSEAVIDSHLPPTYFSREHPDGSPSCVQAWAQQQSSFVLANYPRSGYPPILQVDVPVLAHPRIASRPQYAMLPSNVPPSAGAPYDVIGCLPHEDSNITLAPRSTKERIQLTVALHLYMETYPGPLLDDYTIAQVVFNRVYGIPWSAPANGLLANLNGIISTKLGPCYEEVVHGRDVWTKKACDAYGVWARLCRKNGVEPPPAWVGRW